MWKRISQRNGVALLAKKRAQNSVLGCNLKNDRMISVRFQGKPFSITVIEVYAPTSNAEEAEGEQFQEDLQDLLEISPKKDVLFIIGDWNAKVGNQKTPGVTGKFSLGVCYDQCVLLAKFSQILPCFIPYTKAKFACYSRCFLSSYFCISVRYNEKDIFCGCQFYKVLQVFIEPFLNPQIYKILDNAPYPLAEP